MVEAREDNKCAADPEQREAERLEYQRQRKNAESDDAAFESQRGAGTHSSRRRSLGFEFTAVSFAHCAPPCPARRIHASRGHSSARLSASRRLAHLILSRHDDPDIAARAAVRAWTRCFSPHWLDQLRLAGDRVRRLAPSGHKRARPDADGDISLWQSLHRRIDGSRTASPSIREQSLRALHPLELRRPGGSSAAFR